jgi:predicted O-methyltransferase YrrM
MDDTGKAVVGSAGMRETDRQFAGSIPETYDRYLGPLLSEPYARDLAARLAALAPARVLETAAGTGVATRALARALPAGTVIVATDLVWGFACQALIAAAPPVRLLGGVRPVGGRG